MRKKVFALSAAVLLVSIAFAHARPAAVPGEALAPRAVEPSSASQPGIDVSGVFSVNKAQRGGTFQGAAVLGIPGGYHINSNRPTNKFMIPTSVRVTGPRGVRIGPVRYPRAIVRTFGFAPDERLPVFEGSPAMRFDVTVPATYKQDKLRLRLVVAYQACSNEACFRPAERDVTLSINVADADEQVERINGHVFGGRGRRR